MIFDQVEENFERLLSDDLWEPELFFETEKMLAEAFFLLLELDDPTKVVELAQLYYDVAMKYRPKTEPINMPSSTLYHFKKSKNPSIRTLAKVIHYSRYL